jgi:hypothetical protein
MAYNEITWHAKSFNIFLGAILLISLVHLVNEDAPLCQNLWGKKLPLCFVKFKASMP